MSRIKPRDADEAALLAFIAGTLYSLAQGALLQFDDSRMTPDPLLAANPWLSGFYVDSAMMRVSALSWRTNERLKIKTDWAPKVRETVNQLKHDIDAGIEKGWQVRFADILSGIDDVCGALEKTFS
jgi:hypothetical protein